MQIKSTLRCIIATAKSLIDDALKALEEEFADDFVRIHRSVLVALRQIDRLEKNCRWQNARLCCAMNSLVLTRQLTISRRHVADVRRRLKGI